VGIYVTEIHVRANTQETIQMCGTADWHSDVTPCTLERYQRTEESTALSSRKLVRVYQLDGVISQKTVILKFTPKEPQMLLSTELSLERFPFSSLAVCTFQPISKLYCNSFFVVPSSSAFNCNFNYNIVCVNQIVDTNEAQMRLCIWNICKYMFNVISS
jgi:hypothetical protein